MKITKYFNYEPMFNSVFSRYYLLRIKDGVYAINLDDKQSKGTHWVSSFTGRYTAVYFDSFGIEYIPQEVLSKIKNNSITHNMFRIQVVNSMCGFYFIAFVEYMLAGKSLLDYTNLLSPDDYKKNGKTIYRYFKDKHVKRKHKPWIYA